MSDDEYQRRARYLHWVVEAFQAAPFNDQAITTTNRMLAEQAESDPVAAEVSNGMFVWSSRWFNPYRVGLEAVDRAGVFNEVRAELRMAIELAEL